ncbi:amino acid adenylation domain-containing protein [Fictibacillus nanhaiensis]
MTNQSNDSAYIMYTSGTTGRPKGVEISHKNVLRLVKNTNYINLSTDTVILQTGAISFDATTFEIWATLLNGGRLILIDKDKLLDTESLKQTISENSVNTMWLTSPLFNYLFTEDIHLFKELHTLIVGGDVLLADNINMLIEEYPHLRIINGYGPTENTTFSTTYLIEEKHENIPIGKPISNSKAYILNKYNHLQPIGVPGELHLGGDGLAKGYLNNNFLTQERFISNPFNQKEKLYKSGDLARWLPDGNIEFLGRIDKQVKIRGFRVEIGEIERNILKHHKVKEAIVITKEQKNNEKSLYLYYTLKEVESPSELKKFLSRLLPNYMIPSKFIEVDSIPLTTNGKVDTKKLPVNDTFEISITTSPQNDIERYLVDLWRDTLRLKDVGVEDDFHNLGGNSLSAVLISSRIQKQFNIKFPFSKVLKLLTIKEIAQDIKYTKKEKKVNITKLDLRNNR